MTTAQERKQQERTARRRRIQRAARTVFADKGYAKTSIEQIAREASLSVGAIYLYFRSKEDLYVSLLEETLEAFDTELREIRGQGAPDRLRMAWDYLVQWALSDVEASRVLRLTSQPNIRTQLSDEVVEAVGKGLSQVREHLAAIVEEGVARGTYHHGSPQQVVDLFWCLLLGVLQASDARANLDMPGASYAELAQTAFAAVESGLRSVGQRHQQAA